MVFPLKNKSPRHAVLLTIQDKWIKCKNCVRFLNIDPITDCFVLSQCLQSNLSHSDFKYV